MPDRRAIPWPRLYCPTCAARPSQAASNQLDIGNHAAELAAARGQESLHVYVFARRSSDGKDWSGEPSLRPFFAALPADQAGLFDLRPLRARLAGQAGSAEFGAVHELCLRYDALVLFPSLSAATDVAAESK